MKVKSQNFINYIIIFTIFSSSFIFGDIFSFADLRISYLIMLLALFGNFLVAYNSFKENPVFGSGLGSHKLSYYKYISDIVNVNKKGISTIKKFSMNLILQK